MARSRSLCWWMPVVVAALVGCRPPEFPPRAVPLPEADVGYTIDAIETRLPATTTELDRSARGRLDRFAAAFDGADIRQALVEVPFGIGDTLGVDIARYLDERGITTVVEEVPRSGVRVTGERVDVVASRCPDFASARVPHPLDPLWGNPNPSDQLAFGCAGDSNLEAMVADRGDLTGGGRTAPATAAGTIGAVRRYNDNDVTPLRETTALQTGL
ncbi:MAG: CpaD family pilus assembly lipoprotein [Pseudomonadota bacterium]